MREKWYPLGPPNWSFHRDLVKKDLSSYSTDWGGGVISTAVHEERAEEKEKNGSAPWGPLLKRWGCFQNP